MPIGASLGGRLVVPLLVGSLHVGATTAELPAEDSSRIEASTLAGPDCGVLDHRPGAVIDRPDDPGRPEAPGQTRSHRIRGLFSDIRAGILAAGSSVGRSAGLHVNAQAGFAFSRIRPILSATLGRTEAPSLRDSKTKRSWLFLTAGSEVVLGRDQLDLAVTVGGGAARRHDDDGRSSPHWSPVAAVGLHVRTEDAHPWPWSFSATLIQDDILDRLLGEGSGSTHLVLGAGVVFP